MKKEISRPWVSDYFSTALLYYFSTKVMTQRELAARVGIQPATMNDYVHMKRGKGASEDMRRAICKVIEWQYEDFISLGRLITEGFKADEWDRDYDIRNTDPKYRVWVRRNRMSANVRDLLLVPLPGYRAVDGYDSKVVPRDLWEPEHRFTFVPVYASSANPGGALCAPAGTRAFPNSWLASKGITEGSQCFCFTGMDDALPNDISPLDTIMIHIPGGKVDLIEGKIYAIWETATNRVVCRRLTRREGKVYVYNDKPVIFPPYLAEEASMQVLGPVIWIGKDIR